MSKIKNKLYKEFYSSFKKINKNKIKNVFITSDLSSLHKIDIKNNQKIQIILKALIDSLGKGYTIFFPAASLNLIGKKKFFDKKNTRTYSMGSLSEYIRKYKKCDRSNHPYWSILGIGKNSKILRSTSSHAFAHESAWSKMLELDTLQINLNIEPWNAVSLIHFVETIMGVPYRYNKEFQHSMKIDGKIYKKKFYLPVRFNSPKIRKKYNKNLIFFKIMKKNKKLFFNKNFYGQNIWSFKMRDFFEVSVKELKRNIYTCVNKPIKKYKNY